MKLGTASVGSCISSATWSVAMKNALATSAPPSKGVLPAREKGPFERIVPRVSPHHSCPVASVGPGELSVAGSGTVPSGVWPYQILLMACAWARVTQLLAPPSLVPTGQSTVGSFVGS